MAIKRHVFLFFSRNIRRGSHISIPTRHVRFVSKVIQWQLILTLFSDNSADEELNARWEKRTSFMCYGKVYKNNEIYIYNKLNIIKM